MDHSQSADGSDRPLLAAIAVVLVVYVVSALAGAPQHGAKLVRDAHSAEGDVAPAHDEHVAGHAKVDKHPDLWTVIPFVLLLAAIAVLPLIPATEHWWESNRNRFIVAATLGILTLLYYLILHSHPIDGHWPVHHVIGPSETGLNFGMTWTVLANAILNEYIPFIMLLFSLYTISGGIRIQGDLRAHPLTNSTFIAAGGMLASFIGTTGAAMLLIRPLLETNSERRHVKHTVIFFIFVVCNCGGCLLPIGDPPLFLGYLRGVPFLWTFALWKEWLFVNVCLIGIYYAWDHFWCYPHEEAIDIARDETRVRGLRFSGVWPNALLLVGVVFSVALLDPSKPLPGTDWHPWLYLREIVQLGLIALSLMLGSKEVRQANNFNYHAIIEVAALFFGIFVCMQPPLQILGIQGPELGLSSPMHFFWLTGSLSSVLDNAPTYVVFFETARTLGGENLVPPHSGVAESLLVAVSLGAVFMGAMTYIGNGPNFMVKAIAEKSGIRMPSFFGYMLYSCAILLPLLVLTSWIFL
ncbi:MAG: sodium:proton antiporter [Pirellulales bacterium]|nr:sodium:proton antiporter [Pirellulales bacterium]